MVRRAYVDRFPEREVELVVVKTEGDREQDRSLAGFEGRGVFVRDIEKRLLDGDIDAAVHSAKDLAVDEVEGLDLAAFLPREDASDVLIRRTPGDRPGPGFRVATDSARRRAQLEDLWPGVEFVDIRGNVETRLRKLAEGLADGLVLAAAGLRRLQLGPENEELLSTSSCVPAPGQGAIVVQTRLGDATTDDIRWINHHATALAVHTERDMAAVLDAGCSYPLGVYVEFRAGETRLVAAYHDGERLFRVESRSAAGAPGEAVEGAMADLRDRGARLGARG